MPRELTAHAPRTPPQLPLLALANEDSEANVQVRWFGCLARVIAISQGASSGQRPKKEHATLGEIVDGEVIGRESRENVGSFKNIT